MGQAQKDALRAAESPDARLLAARAGSRTALGEVLDECRNYLLLIANRELGEAIQSKVGASDLVQETFVEAQNIFARFEGKSRQELCLWLARILEFKLAQATRKFASTHKRDVRRERSLETLTQDEWLSVSADSAAETTCLSEKLAKFAALQAALQRLPPEHRLAIEMRSFEKRPFAELAVKLGRTTDAARRLWLRAVVRLRMELTGSERNAQDRSNV